MKAAHQRRSGETKRSVDKHVLPEEVTGTEPTAGNPASSLLGILHRRQARRRPEAEYLEPGHLQHRRDPPYGIAIPILGPVIELFPVHQVGVVLGVPFR